VSNTPNGLSPVKQALSEIRRLRQRLEVAEGARRDPIAVVGLGVRFPGGATDADQFHAQLCGGLDAIGDVPAGRWDVERFFSAEREEPGTMYTRRGGFLTDVAGFDPEFFGISPFEASTIDPQQRLLLEVSWEALENAGIAPSSLRGSRTGVFVGIAAGDYGRLALADTAEIDEYASLGTAFSVAGGRISYLLGLHGPAVSIDTACSASLVAVHLACQSLRLGESELALAAGVNLILAPEITINFCRAGMLAADGHCKTFDAAADGYVRSEGCGVVVLKRLADARRDGDRVLAVIRGSAVNQDGRSSGLTAPNGPAQEMVIRAALDHAALRPGDIGYIEAHGTGTSLGDPIEIQALGNVFAADRPAGRPLLVGSVKTNVGHLEAAAGMAGLVKTIQALRRREVPPHLHFRTPNPHIAWSGLPLAVPTVRTPFEPINGKRRAGVSSFGFSGTNVHMILEEADEPGDASGGEAPMERPAHILALSAAHETALRDLAGRYAATLATASEPFGDICYSANTGRAHFRHRLAVHAVSAREASQALTAWLAGAAPGTVHSGKVIGSSPPPVAFLFAAECERPERAIWALQQTSPVVRAVLQMCDEALRGILPIPLLDVLDPASSHASCLVRRDYGDAATFAIQLALAELWRSWGFEPAAGIAHSTGEYVAAYLAGVFQLPDALRLVVMRGRLRDSAKASADGGALIADAASLVRSVALHPGAALSLISTRVGGEVPPAELATVAYWDRSLENPHGVASAIQTARRDDAQWFLEMGMGAGLAPREADRRIEGEMWLAPLAENGEPWKRLVDGLARLYVAGADVSWKEVDRGHRRARVTLPTYAFQRRPFWLKRLPNGESTATPRELKDSDGGARGSWDAVVTTVRERSDLAPLDLNIGSYAAKWGALEALTRELGRNVLAGAGVFSAPGMLADVDGALAAGNIATLYRPMVSRWLEALAVSGSLERAAGGFRAVRALEPADLSAQWERVADLLSDNQPLFDYLRNCAALLPDVIAGRVSPLETLFPGGSFELATALYERSTVLRYVNGIAAAALAEYVAQLPASAEIRVLEFGAGTGGTTSSLLPVLPPQRSRYDFTDVSEIFLENAAKRFGQYAFVRPRLFDLEKDPEPQGLAPGSYHVVIGSNVLHAARDLRASLARVRSLLAPGGLLLLIESTGHLAWHDFSTGLIEGWQHFQDDLRRDTPLLPASRWLDLLREAGFEHAEAAPPDGSPAEVLKQHLVFARVSVDAAVSERETATAPVSEVIAKPTAAAAQRSSAPALAAESPFAQRLVSAVGAERDEIAAAAVRDCVIEVLHSDPNRPPSRDARLMDLGLDSLMAVRLKNLLQKRLGLTKKLPATLIFDYPTIGQIARFVIEQTVGARPEMQLATPAPPKASNGREAEVAALTESEVEAILLSRLDAEGLE
jgi:acyl transferase domain-containing protein/SAM-dependent methyltransferase/acyl carrier protein